jgi:putative tryptophan/tyrosine transport system substrate-binding protein
VVVTDPIGAGFVPSLAHPGGNVTGFSTFEPELGGKWLEVLKEAAPHLKRIGVLFDPEFRGFAALWGAITYLAPSFGVRAVPIHGRSGPEINKAIEEFAQQPDGGLIVLPTHINSVQRQPIFALAVQHRLPAIYPFAFHARDGGLMAYGFNSAALFRRAALYAARILSGERTGDLPRCRCRRSSSLWSTLRPPQRSGSPFRQSSSPAPTR